MQVAFAQYAFVLLDHVEPCFAEDLPVEGVQNTLRYGTASVSRLWLHVSKFEKKRNSWNKFRFLGGIKMR